MLDLIANLLHRIRRALLDLAERVGAAFAFLVAPVERFLGRVLRGAFSTLERVEAAETLAGRIGWVLAWPIRAVAGLVPAPVVRLAAACGEWLRRIGQRVVGGLLWLAEWLDFDWLVGRLVWLLQPVWRPALAIGGFVVSWGVTRPYRQAMGGAPAVVLTLLVVGLAAWHALAGRSQATVRYKAAVREALEARDYPAAQLYEQKLAQLGVDTQLTEFRTAVAMAEQGQLEEARQRIERLAPEDQPGYPAAHFWQIQQLMREGGMQGGGDEPREEVQRRIGVHLAHLESLGISGAAIELVRARWLAGEERWEEAAAVLAPLVPVSPDAALERMRIHLRLDQRDAARIDARALVGHLANRARRSEPMTAVEYQMWLAGEDVLGNLEQMRRILDAWRTLEPENPIARQTLAEVYRRQADRELRAPLPDVARTVGLWLDSIELTGDLEPLRQLAGGLYRQRDQGATFRALLAALRDSPRTPAPVLVHLGTEAAVGKEWDDAQAFLAAAVARDASNAAAWNNYGLVLGEGPTPKLEEALAAVNRALVLAPGEYRFRETRGQILLRMERWEAAIADLEYALNGLPALASIHASLAQAYAAVGKEDLARLHRGQVE